MNKLYAILLSAVAGITVNVSAKLINEKLKWKAELRRIEEECARNASRVYKCECGATFDSLLDLEIHAGY